MTPDPAAVEAVLSAALAEDIGRGDLTSQLTVPEGARLSAAMVAREPLVACGLSIAAMAFRRLASSARITTPVADGATRPAGSVLMTVEGPARALLAAERTALNIVQHLSGIASLTARYAAQLEGTDCELLDTRKTLPGLRRLQKYAARAGGAQNHRMGLDDGVLIKDNHIAVAAAHGLDLAQIVRRAKAGTRLIVEVEIDRLDQIEPALEGGADVLLLDNMDLATLRQAVAQVAGRAKLEASGGVTLDSIAAIAATGVNFISVGRLTLSAPAVDVGLDWTPSGP